MLKPADCHVVAIIGARGGSKGLPRKNIRPLAGKPLIAWTIEAAKGCKLIDRVIVSTNDDEIAHVSRAYGAEVPFNRPAELATGDATTESYLQHAVEWLETHEDYKVDIVVYLQLTDIFRKQWMIEEAITKLLENPDLDSAFVGYSTYKNFWKKKGDEYVPLSHRGYGPRQKKARAFREDTGIACATRGHIVKNGKRIGDKVFVIENNDFCSSIDIHTEFDLWLAEKVLTEWGVTIND